MRQNKPKLVPIFLRNVIYDRPSVEPAFSRREWTALKNAGLEPLRITDHKNEPLHFYGDDILAAMQRVAQELRMESDRDIDSAEALE